MAGSDPSGTAGSRQGGPIFSYRARPAPCAPTLFRSDSQGFPGCLENRRLVEWQGAAGGDATAGAQTELGVGGGNGVKCRGVPSSERL